MLVPKIKSNSFSNFRFSEKTINKAKNYVAERNLTDRIDLIVGAAENLKFENEFDLILGTSILHHLDLNITSKILQKALRQNGKALFLEPLNHNPIINLFRILTPWRRSEDEKPLDIKDVEAFKKHFSNVKYYGYCFLSLFAFAVVPFKLYSLFCLLTRRLDLLDQKLFKWFPKLQKYSWGAIVILVK
jgi:SAM-dependent methyltransferase